MIIRRALPVDVVSIRHLFAEVYTEAFFDRLHDDQELLPTLSFVALAGGSRVIGHVGATRGRVGSTPALALVAPSVDPAQRGRGVGKALMHTIMGAAEANGEPLIGSAAIPTEYYRQFGFRPSEELGIIPSVRGWQPFFLVRPLTAYDPSMSGTFTFPDPFL